MKLLDKKAVKSEINSINTQSVVVAVVQFALTINSIMVSVYGIKKRWVLLWCSLLYCFSFCLIYNYFLIVHHRIFKETNEVQSEAAS